MQTTHVAIVTLRPQPTLAEAFHQAMLTVQADLPRAPGCNGVLVLQDGADPATYTLVESWQSQAAHSAHLEGLKSSGAWDALSAMLRAEPEAASLIPVEIPA